MNQKEEFEDYQSKLFEQIDEEKFDEALLTCRKALKIKPQDFYIQKKKIEILKYLNKYKKVLIEIKQLIQTVSDDTNQADLYFELGDLFLNRKKYKKAQVHFKIAIRKNDFLNFKCYNQGVKFLAQEEFEKAFVCYKSVGYKFSSKHSALIGEGNFYFHKEKFALAKKCYKRSKAMKPINNFLASVNLSLVLACEQKQEEAKQLLLKGLEKCGQYSFKSLIDYSCKPRLKMYEKKFGSNISEDEKALVKIRLDGIKFIMSLLGEMLEKSKKSNYQFNL